MRVTLVSLDDGEAWFAPHANHTWLVLPAGNGVTDEVPEAGQVGDLEVEDDGWTFELDRACRAELVTLSAVGGAKDGMAFRLGADQEPTDLSGHGVAADLKEQASRLGFWRLKPRAPDGIVGHFNEAGVAAWAKTTRDEEKARRRQIARNRQQREQAADYFVNPYTFVPFPQQPPQRDNRPTITSSVLSIIRAR